MSARWLLAFALSLPGAASALSTGSPDCNLTQHGAPPTAGSGGFAMSMPASYVGGAPLTVTLTGASSFKGLLLFGANSNGAHRGSWQLPAGFRTVPGCDGSDTNTLTHTSATPKATPVEFTWTAPPAGTGVMTMRATVAVDFTTFFVIQAQLSESVDAVFANGFE